MLDLRMNDNNNGSRYPLKVCGVKNQHDGCSSLRFKVSNFNAMDGRASNRPEEEEAVEDKEIREEDGKINGVRIIGKDTDDDDNVGREEYDSDDSDDDDDDDDEDTDECGDVNGDNGKAEDVGNGRAKKKQKLRTLVSNYEFAPRVPTPLVQQPLLSQPSFGGGQNTVRDWTEQETFALLDAWGDLFLRRERKSLRAEEWQKVAEKVSQQTNMDRTDVQCRNRLDTIKKKYKKEKAKIVSGGSGTGTSKWIYYKKMDMLLSTPPKQQIGLSCGFDSGEYVFMNPNAYMNLANGMDEMRDSPENWIDTDKLPPKRKRDATKKVDNRSFSLLVDSIDKFSNIYEKIESSKTKQMLELENMRMDIQKQIETQRKLILEKAQAEITKIRQGHDYENANKNDLSPENLSG